MGFLAPAVFLTGSALLLAILATYLLRPRRPARRVSSTLLWLAALNDVHAQRPWRRVPPSVLLLLQLAALAAMVAALARPFVLTGESTGLDTIVLLDASASMQATDVSPTRFEVARARVAQMIDALEPAQTLGLISLDAQPRVVAQPSSDRGQLRRALDTIQSTTQTANLPVALSLAASLAEGHADAQVVVVGDGSVDRAHAPAGFSLPLRYVGVGSPGAANLAVAGLNTRVLDGRVSTLARVVNYGPQTSSATLVLRVDGTRYDARPLSIEPGSAADVQWDDLPAAAHTLEARLDQPDSLALDDAAWAVLDGDRPTRVLLVSEGNVFVEQALALRPGTQVTRVSPGAYTPQPQAFDLIVADDFVPAVLPTGSSLLLLHPPTNNGLLGVGPDVSISNVSAARPADALLADVPLASVHVSRSRRLDSTAWADVVLSSPETPLLLVGEHSGRRVGVLGFDVHQSDLPLQPGFPVLVQHLLDWLVPRSSTATPVVQVGESISLAPLPEAVNVDVIGPDGRRTQVVPPMPPAPFSGTDLPGVYRLVQRDASASGRESTTFFAANFLNASESQLRPGTDTGAPTVGPRRDPLKAPHEFWEALAVIGLLLLGIEAALAWWQFTAATLRARLALALRMAMAALLVLALLGVGIPQRVDSVAQAQPDLATFISQAVAKKGADDAFAVVATARSAAVAQSLSGTARPFSDAASTEAPPAVDATDLSAGLRLASNLLPAGYRPRLVLLSDGQETSGDAVAQARSLQARGVEVDVVPLAAVSGPEVLIDNISAPAVVHEGERFSIGIRLVSNVATDGTLRVFVDGQPLAEQPVSLPPGTTDLAFSAQAPQAGLLDVRASLDAEQDTRAANNEARSVVEVQGPPRVLIVEQRPGEGALIASALSSSGMRLEMRAVADVPEQIDPLAGFAAVVLADVSAESLTEAQQTILRTYVRDLGRGLLAIGGDTSFGQGEYVGTPLDDALPVRSSVRSHRDQGRVALLLVMDTSGSMSDDIYHEGTTKIEMAKQAALLSTQQLSPRDQVGILTFDSFRHWVLPMTGVLGLGSTAIQDRLAPLGADGGTDIYPALATAFDAIKQTDARYKHIILMTDGMSCCAGSYPDLLERMRTADVTLSTIAIGGDADQQLLSQLARQGDGRYYFADHARDIPRLMTRETELATRGPVVEGNVAPRQVGPDALLSTVAAGGLPPLSGYLVTSPKDLAEVMLVSDAADPLLARWQYGLGRAVAWTSDLRGRWSDAWTTWPGTAQLFSGLVGWTIAPAQGPLRLGVRADAQTGYVTVDDTEPGQQPGQVRVHVAQPGGAPLEMDLAASGPGRYAGSFGLNGVGTYIVRAEEQRDGAAIGSAEAGLPVSYPAEFRQVTGDTRRLEQIARAGGGHVLSTPAAAFADDLAPISVPLPLQRTLLLAAAILLPLEVGLRRLRVSPLDALEWLKHPHRIELAGPWQRSGDAWPRPPAWVPGATARRPAAPRVSRPYASEPTFSGQVTPGLARQTDAEDGEDALGATLKWLAARRGGSHRGDSG
ncbi:MAG: VWA domain-containing protein [Chloroflexi bacterium]|nr:VWA domain-containing protein [Chloroflexota bacterium]